MANNRIKGLTVEIGGDTTKLGQALADVDKKSRDLQGELREVNKLLKFDPKNPELLAQKQQILAKAIETTKEKLDKLKQAEKQVQQQFERGEVSEEQVRALQREIAKTEQEMVRYEREAEDAAKATEKVGDEAKEAADKTSKFGDKIKAAGEVAAKGLAVLGAAAVAAVTAMAKATTSAAAYADEVLTLSTVTGISTEKLQAYKYASELVDVSVETLTKSHAKNIKSMKAAQDGTKLMVDAYQQLGVAVTNADGSLRDGETVYWEVIDALGQMENETERDAIAMQILGKSAQELNPLIEAGSARMQELTQEAREVGAVMSDETLGALGSFDDAMQRLQGSAGAAKNALGTVLVPELTKLATEGTALLAEFTSTLNASGGGLEGFIATVDQMGTEIGGKIGELLGGIVSKAAELLPGMTELAISLVLTLAKSIVDTLPRLIDTVVQALVEGIPMIIEGALELFMAILDAIPKILPPLVNAIPRIVMSIVGALTNPEMIQKLIDGALQLLMALIDAIPLLIERLVPMIPQIVVAVCNALIKAAPQLLKAAVTLFGALVKAIPQACSALLKSLPQIWNTISSYLKQLPSKVVSIGKDLVAGLWKGIKDKATWLKNKITGWVGDVTKFLKKLFGINSPSKVTAYMGEMLDAGLAVGIEDNAKQPMRALGDLSADMLDEASQLNGLTLERRLTHVFNPGTPSDGASTMLGKLDQILLAIERGQVLTIDGNALVGATANSMNNALGQRRILAERGAV